MATKGPLDELQWREPEAVEYYKGIRAENIHLYFIISPFCDISSNNRLLFTQMGRNPSLFGVLENRRLFEDRLRSMAGIGYFVVDGPEISTPDMNPVWVIRKTRRAPSSNVTETLGTYYALGENIYQASSLLDVLHCRMVNTLK
jgi:MED6 mediator sub complex component